MREICQGKLLEMLDERLKKAPLRLAIEGGSASGKTTLARLLEERYEAAVLHMDDFFLQPHQRTVPRLEEPGGNVDRERFLAEVLLPLSTGKAIEYRRFDCKTKTIEPPICLFPKRLTVIEGAYSMHPELSQFYDLSVFLDVESETQRARILKRNPQTADRFFSEWIPLEVRYFEMTHAKERCDFIIKQQQVR